MEGSRINIKYVLGCVEPLQELKMILILRSLWDREDGVIVDSYSKTGGKELGGEKRSWF